MRRGMMEADVVISTGGTSMGEADLIKVHLYDLFPILLYKAEHNSCFLSPPSLLIRNASAPSRAHL
jgi:hypothetical protein